MTLGLLNCVAHGVDFTVFLSTEMAARMVFACTSILPSFRQSGQSQKSKYFCLPCVICPVLLVLLLLVVVVVVVVCVCVCSFLFDFVFGFWLVGCVFGGRGIGGGWRGYFTCFFLH